MKITALDIRQKTFEKSFRGVDKDEVQAFLNTISQQWERMGDENRELRLKLEHAQQDVQKMREVESSLYRTLKTAEDTGNNITEQAQREAALRVREAQLQAEHLLADAASTPAA
jgi:cell division initiation protein